MKKDRPAWRSFSGSIAPAAHIAVLHWLRRRASPALPETPRTAAARRAYSLAFRLFLDASQPITPRPATKNGRAGGNGVIV